MYKEQIPWIEGTPLGLKIRKAKFIPLHLHEDIIEIIFCLQGSIKFDYAYEQFTLHEGEFVSVDKDAHYLHSGEDAVCVSYYIDLKWFREKYPYITNLLFVCEYCADSETPKRECHDRLKGILIALLFYLGSREEIDDECREVITKSVGEIVDLFVNQFDIIFFYDPHMELSPELMERHREFSSFLQTHSGERLTLKDLADEFHLAESYISEFLRKVDVGFRGSLGYMRAYRSEKFLLSTDITITEISELCGFSDPKYYYEAFKKWYHCTPRQFRKSFKDKMEGDAEESALKISDVHDLLDELMTDHYLELFL